MDSIIKHLSELSLQDAPPQTPPELVVIRSLVEENKKLKLYIQYLESVISHQEKSIPEWVC